MSERGKFKNPYRRFSKKPRGTSASAQDTDIDHAFFERAYMAPISSSRGPVRLDDPLGPRFGPVRILNAVGECVRVIGMDELAKRCVPFQSDWVGSQDTWNNRQRGVKPRVKA